MTQTFHPCPGRTIAEAMRAGTLFTSEPAAALMPAARTIGQHTAWIGDWWPEYQGRTITVYRVVGGGIGGFILADPVQAVVPYVHL